MGCVHNWDTATEKAREIKLIIIQYKKAQENGL